MQSGRQSQLHDAMGVKVVIVGPSGVGKTSISNRFAKDQFTGRVAATMGAAFVQKLFQYGPKKMMRMQLWDTAGQEKYRSIARIYYQDAKVAILVYDVTSKSSFESMQSWAEEVRNNTSKSIVLAVVGNKIDLLSQNYDEQIDNAKYTTAKEYARKIGAIFKIVSAKNSIGVRELFAQIAEMVAHQQEPPPKPVLKLPSAGRRSPSCCL